MNKHRALMCISPPWLLWGTARKKWWYTRLELWNHIAPFMCCHCFGGWIAVKISAALQVPLFPPPPYLPHSSSDSNAAPLLPSCPGNCHPEISIVFTVNTTEGGDEVCSDGVPRTALYTQSVMGDLNLPVICLLIIVKVLWLCTHSFFAYILFTCVYIYT